VAFLSALAATIAYILPPVYRSDASILVEPQQIPDELAQTTVPVNPYEQAQIIEQRLMTRANLLELAERVGLYDDQPEMSAGAIVSDMRQRVEFIGFTPDATEQLWIPGATIIGIAFEAPTGPLANKGANELMSLVLHENVRLRTGRAGDTLEFFQAEVERLEAALEKQSGRIAAFKTANVEALPDSMATRRAQQQLEQERVLAGEVVVDRRLPHPGRVGDRAGAGRGEPDGAEEGRGGVQHVATGVAVTGGVAARARSPWSACHGWPTLPPPHTPPTCTSQAAGFGRNTGFTSR
jgi:hypothetical protein